MHKCEFPEGIRILPDGRNELDPCLYEEVERWRNVTVSVLRCPICGHTEISWFRQEDTEPADMEEEPPLIYDS